MALRKDVVDLASESLTSDLLPRQREYPSRTQKVLSELAARGIAGGPSANLTGREAIDEIETRIEIATKELERAADSKGLRYNKNLGADLGAALDQLCEGRYNDVLADFDSNANALPNPAQTKSAYGEIFSRTAQNALRKGKSDLLHYAEQLKTKRGQTIIDNVVRAGYTLLGAALTLAVQYITILLQAHKSTP